MGLQWCSCIYTLGGIIDDHIRYKVISPYMVLVLGKMGYKRITKLHLFQSNSRVCSVSFSFIMALVYHKNHNIFTCVCEEKINAGHTCEMEVSYIKVVVSDPLNVEKI